MPRRGTGQRNFVCSLTGLGLGLAFLATSANAQELGQRVFRMGGDGQLYAAVLAGIPLGPWQGGLVLQAGEPDESGAVALTGSGLIWVDILGGAQGRSCRRFDSCAGTLYCDGGVNSDVSATHDSAGCQGVVGGSGNRPVVTLMTGQSDSGPGSMIVTCQVAEASFRTQGSMPDCSEVVDGDGVNSYAPAAPVVFTTGTSLTHPLNQCGNLARDTSAMGENFVCEDWNMEGSAGVLVATMIQEEQEGTAFDVGLYMVLDDTACGNGLPDEGEECDTAGDSETCDADCSAPLCGDGHVNEAAGESCESSADCELAEICSQECGCIPEPVCGNGDVEEGEECDDAGESQTCDSDCSFAECGDDLWNSTSGEACEQDLNCAEGEICGPGCECVEADVCGNGVLESNEQCDDGNSGAGDGCSAACRSELPFQLAVANLNLLHDVFEDNDIIDRLGLTADALAEEPPDIATFQEVAFVGDRDAHQILIDDLLIRYELVYYGVKYGDPSAGQAVISRWPVKLEEAEMLPTQAAEPDFPDARWFGRVVVASPVGPLDVYAWHFCADCNHAERSIQAAAALDFLTSTRESGHPFIVGADFNAHRGTAPDSNPTNDPAIDVLMDAGLTVHFDGFDAPCNAPTDRSGCTSGQDLYAAQDTTQRRIDNIMTGDVGAFSAVVELGPSETFADERRDDPNRECALEPSLICNLSSECPDGHECSRGACVALDPACEADENCSEGSICRVDLWPSDHLGVRTTLKLVPEPGAALLWLGALCGVVGLRARARSGATPHRS